MGNKFFMGISWTKIARTAVAGGLAITMAGALVPACPPVGATLPGAVQAAQAEETQDVVTVSDNITEDTVWQAGKTYQLAGEISIKAGTSLEIQSGAKVVNASSTGSSSLHVYGTLNATGADFAGVSVRAGNTAGELCAINLKQCSFSGLYSLWFGSGSQKIELLGNTFGEEGSVDITNYDNKYVDIEQNDFHGGFDCRMEGTQYSLIVNGNRFERDADSGYTYDSEISVYGSPAVASFEKNVFHGCSVYISSMGGVSFNGNAFLGCEISGGCRGDNATCQVSGNDFYGTGIALELTSDNYSMTATNNWFGTIDEAEISKRISDARSNFSLTKEIDVTDNASAPVSGLEEPKHTMGEWETISSPTTESTGLERRTCSVCGYSEERTLPKLTRTDISECTISGIEDEQYTGYAIRQDALRVKHGDKLLATGEYGSQESWADYYVTYSDNVEPGTATVTITGIGTYQGSVTKTFKIAKRTISSCGPQAQDQTYDGTAKTPVVTFDLTDHDANDITPVPGTDYDVTYANNVEIGTASFTVTAKGDHFTGSYTGTFEIRPTDEYLQKQISDLQAQISALKQETGKSSTSNCDCDFSKVNSSLASVSKTLSELQKSVKSLEGGSASASRVSDIEKSVEGLSGTVAELQKSVSSLRGAAATTEQVGDVEKSVASLSESVDSLARAVAALQEGSATRSQVEELRGTVEALQRQMAATAVVSQSAPRALAVTAGKRSLKATWKAPKKLSSYGKVTWQYRYRASGGTWKSWKSTKARRATVKKLKRGSSYDFEVRAKVKVGATKVLSGTSDRTVKVR